jgi:hypothetical protein
MSDRFVVSVNFISKSLKSGCRKNCVCISCARWLFCWRIRMSLKKQSFCVLNTKITILPDILMDT